MEASLSRSADFDVDFLTAVLCDADAARRCFVGPDERAIIAAYRAKLQTNIEFYGRIIKAFYPM